MTLLPSSEEYVDFARFLADQSAGAILPLFRKQLAVDVKAAKDWDPVTEADRAAEAVIRRQIEERFPDHGIIGEEYGVKPSRSGFTWILDPIDGTRAFVIGMPTWATLIGLYYEDRPLLGIMNQPFIGERFVGAPGSTTVERGNERRKLGVRPCLDLSTARIGTTTPHLYPVLGEGLGFEGLRRKVEHTRYGGDAYFFCLVAMGLLDIAVDANLQIYDIAALIPIIEGAGGHVLEWTGRDPVKGGNIVAASSPDLAQQAAAYLRGEITTS